MMKRIGRNQSLGGPRQSRQLSTRRLYGPPARVSGNVRQVSFATIRPAYCDPEEKLKMQSDSFLLSILISNVARLAPLVSI
jgi:hypothetical protein